MTSMHVIRGFVIKKIEEKIDVGVNNLDFF